MSSCISPIALKPGFNVLTNLPGRMFPKQSPFLPLHMHVDDGIECLTPGHFLVGHPLQTLPPHRQQATSRQAMVTLPSTLLALLEKMVAGVPPATSEADKVEDTFS